LQHGSGADRSLHQIAAAVGTNLEQDLFGAGATECALKGADVGHVLVWWQIAVAVFAIWAQCQHVDVTPQPGSR